MPEGKTKIRLHVHPGSAHNEAVSFADGVLRVRVAAPPTKGKANKELLAFLSQLLEVNQDALTIVAGHTSRNKTLSIEGLSREEVWRQLSKRTRLSSSGNASK